MDLKSLKCQKIILEYQKWSLELNVIKDVKYHSTNISVMGRYVGDLSCQSCTIVKSLCISGLLLSMLIPCTNSVINLQLLLTLFRTSMKPLPQHYTSQSMVLRNSKGCWVRMFINYKISKQSQQQQQQQFFYHIFLGVGYVDSFLSFKSIKGHLLGNMKH